MNIKHKHDKKIYVIEWLVINILWKGIISYLWVHAGARLGGTRLNSQSLDQLFQQDRALDNLTWQPLECYWWGLVPRKLHSDGISMEGRYESANHQDRSTAMIAGYTITPSDTKITCNSFFIVLISKITIFTYEIRHLDPLTQTISLSITSNTIFYILHEKCSELHPTLHDLHWFLILIHPLLSYSYNTNEGKQL
jgi:hypothetical protein